MREFDTVTTADKSKRSRARLGADQARVWARGLSLGNPHAKAVLLALANYMNESGTAYPGIATLAADTDLSEDTVVNRLRWLESIGAVAIFKCWVDENGNRNSRGEGRPTSSEIRFLFDADADDIEAKAQPDRPRKLTGAAAASHAAKSDVSPRPHREQNPSHLQQVSAGLAPGQPPTPSARTEEPELEDSPLTPLAGGDPPSVEGWEEFKTAFEADGHPILKVSLALTLLGAMTPDEKALAIKAAKGLIAIRGRDKKPGPKPAAQIFLREKASHPSYAKQAPPDPVKCRVIAKGSPEYAALSVFNVLLRRVPFASETIEAREELASRADLLALAGESTDRSLWIGLDDSNPEHKAPIGAWRERIKQWTGKWPELEELPLLDENGIQRVSVQEWNGKKLEFKQTYKGLAVPRRWPPRMDGTWPESNLAQAG